MAWMSRFLKDSLPQPIAKTALAHYAVADLGINDGSCGEKAAKATELLNIFQDLAFHIDCGG